MESFQTTVGYEMFVSPVIQKMTTEIAIIYILSTSTSFYILMLQVGLGIMVENYSKYKLTDQQTSGPANCGWNKEVSKIVIQ